jgi:hypothetical protein
MSDTYTKSLLHFNGYNNSTLVEDFGSTKVWTAGGTAKLTITTKKFGRSCLYLDGDTAYISTPDHADFTLGLAAFSFDFWLKFPVLPGVTPQCIFSKYQDTNNRFYLEVYESSGDYIFRFRSRESATLLNDASFTLPSLSVDTWTHFELTRSGSTLYLFQDGGLVSTSSGALEVSDLTGAFEIGRNGTGSYLNAYVDEFRYSYGIARHVTSFTPATYAYIRLNVDDEFTALLHHFNTTTTVDANGFAWTKGSGDVEGTYKKFGAGAVSEAGPSCSLTLPNRIGNLWKHDCWTIDFQLLFHSLGTVAQYAWLFTTFGAAGGYNYFRHIYGEDATTSKLAFSSGTVAASFDWPSHPVIDTWYHIAIVCNNKYITVYVDGADCGTVDCTAEITTMASYSADNAWQILNGGDGAVYIDELRVSTAIKRWTASFVGATPSDEYGTTQKYADVTFGATGSAAFDSLWDNMDPTAEGTDTFFGQMLYEKAIPTIAGAATADDFTGQYWYEKVNTESAVSSALFNTGYYVPWNLPATAVVTFDGNYVVFIDVPAMDIPFPSLQGQCGYNAVAEMTVILPTLEICTGLDIDSDLPVMTLTATGSRSLSCDLAVILPFPTLNASVDPSLWITLAKNIPLPSLNSYSYVIGTNELAENLPFIAVYANAVNSRTFSTYVLEYTR